MTQSPEVLKTRNAPRRNVVKRVDPLSSPNTVRVYRNSPEDVMLQLRRVTDYASITLTFDEAQQPNMLMAAVADREVA